MCLNEHIMTSMIKIETNKFDSWNSISNFIDDNFAYFNNFRFRGHSDANWKLESTLTRAINRIKSGEEKEKILERHLSEFKKNLRGRCNLNLNEISENELYAIGQHFGLYTPFLDWTFSPYVGLFFALQGESKSGKRCLWAIAEALEYEVNNTTKERNKIISFISPLSNENPRLVSQQGLFLKLPINESLEEIVRTAETSKEGIQIYKLIFTDSLKNDFLARLNNMNINNLTLFPDLTGSSLHTNYLLEIEPHLKKKRDERWVKFKKDKKVYDAKKKKI